MGIKLMVEVFDHWQDAGLTAGERSDLLVLAENANDGSRLTFGPVHADYILRRAGKTANGWKNAIGKLLIKKVLTVHTPGRIKQAAVYRLEPLCPEVRHDGYKGMCARSTERVTPQVTLSEKEGHLSGDPMGHPSGDPLGQEGHLTGVERVTSQVTPTPPYPSFKTPSTTSSTSPAEVSVDEPAVAPDVTTGGGGGSDLRSLAVEIAASLDYCGKPPTTKQRKIIEDRLVVFLEAGWSLDELVVHLDLTGQAIRYAPAVYIDRLDPVELSSRRPSPPTPQAFRGGARGPMPTAADYASATVGTVLFDDRPDTADGGLWERASARASKRTAALAGAGHQPYSNDSWSAPADPAAAAKVPWCGDLDCDEKSRMRDGVDHNGLPFVYQCEKCHPNNRPW